MQNLDIIFEPLLERIQKGEVKTNHQLRIILEELSETFNVKPLHLLITFREWLNQRGLDLKTEHGAVEIITSK